MSQWSKNIQRSLRCICLRLIRTKIIFSCWLLFIIILKLHETNINFILNICVARYEFVSLPILHEDKHAVFILLCLHHKNCFQIWLIIVLPDTIKTLFFLENNWTINEWIWNLYIIFYFILPYANISWMITLNKMQNENL